MYNVIMSARKSDFAQAGDINLYVGQRIKLRRDILGLTQKHLADECGISFQQIQKYESGETRITADRLFQLARVLDVPVSFLFSGLPNQTPAGTYVSVSHGNGFNAKSPGAEDPLAKKESLELIRMFWDLPNDSMRDNILSLIKAMR
jgi:transcriptional regulator with XRE-family HTH domain